jgi:hypothetical protein
MSDLTPTQQTALDQLLMLTAGTDNDTARGVLESVDWDVRVSAYSRLLFSSSLARTDAWLARLRFPCLVIRAKSPVSVLCAASE